MTDSGAGARGPGPGADYLEYAEEQVGEAGLTPELRILAISADTDEQAIVEPGNPTVDGRTSCRPQSFASA